MKLRKVITLAFMTAAIGTISVFSSFADEMTAEEKADAAEANTLFGWVQRGSDWYYYDSNGAMFTGWLKEPGGDGRGNEVWFYLEPSNGVMVANQTRVIDNVSYTFGEDGSWVAPVKVAPKGKISGRTYKNAWANLSVDGIIGDILNEDDEDLYANGDYAAVGSPKRSVDLHIETAQGGELVISFLNMKSKPDMTAEAFVKEFGNIEKGAKGTASEVSTVKIAGQDYAKVTTRGRSSSNDYYCRKQDGYMILIATLGDMSSYLNLFTAAQ